MFVVSFNLDQIRARAQAVRNAATDAALRSLAVRYALAVHHGLAALLDDERAAARYFAYAAVLQERVEKLLRCPVHGESEPCRECQGLERLHSAGLDNQAPDA